MLGALATGMTFFAMAWTGQHVLRALRMDVFEQLHQLSLSFYADNEAGDLMSRITNDTSAIEQAISFALVNVFSAVLGLIWVAYNMITASPCPGAAFAVRHAADVPGHGLLLVAGAQGLPPQPQGDRQRQCRVAGKHRRGPRGAGLHPRR